MKRVMTLVCCFAAGLVFLSGCVGVIGTATRPASTPPKSNDTNLLVKVDFEKNGILIDSISAIVSKDSIPVIQHTYHEKQKKSEMVIGLSFNANNIKKVSKETYSMNYKVRLTVPFVITQNAYGSSTLHTEFVSDSSLNIKLDQPAYIYESNVYKVKMTITVPK